MNLTIRILKIASQDYVAAVSWNEVSARSKAHYPDIETAIRSEAGAAVDFARFVECRYGEMSTGTFESGAMARNAGRHAGRLADLHRAAKVFEFAG